MADLTAATLARIPDAIDAIPAVVESASPLTVTRGIAAGNSLRMLSTASSGDMRTRPSTRPRIAPRTAAMSSALLCEPETRR